MGKWVGVGRMLELINKQEGVCVPDEGESYRCVEGRSESQILWCRRGEVRESNIMVSLWLATIIVSSIEDSVSANE